MHANLVGRRCLSLKIVRRACNYVKSTCGVLKIIETVLCFSVFVCATIAVRNYDAFYGFAVWASLVGFVCMTVSAGMLLADAASIRWPRMEKTYCACAAIAFLFAGVLLAPLAEAGVSKPRGHVLRSSVADDKFTEEEAWPMLGPLTYPTVLGPPTIRYSKVPETIRWIVDITPTNPHGFRSAVFASVFSFIATFLFTADIYLMNS